MEASEFQAQALRPVCEYAGLCRLKVSSSAVSITAISSHDNTCSDLGTWPLDCIRQFTSRPVGIFSFISGRRGPYGVAEYEFKLLERDLFALNSCINKHTGTVLDTTRPDVPESRVFQRLASVDQIYDIPTPNSSHEFHNVSNGASNGVKPHSPPVEQLYDVPRPTALSLRNSSVPNFHHYEMATPVSRTPPVFSDVPSNPSCSPSQIYDVPRPSLSSPACLTHSSLFSEPSPDRSKPPTLWNGHSSPVTDPSLNNGTPSQNSTALKSTRSPDTAQTSCRPPAPIPVKPPAPDPLPNNYVNINTIVGSPMNHSTPPRPDGCDYVNIDLAGGTNLGNDTTKHINGTIYSNTTPNGSSQFLEGLKNGMQTHYE